MFNHYPTITRHNQMNGYEDIRNNIWNYELIVEMDATIKSSTSFQFFNDLCHDLIAADLKLRRKHLANTITIGQKVRIGADIIFSDEVKIDLDDESGIATGRPFNWNDLAIWNQKTGQYQIIISSSTSTSIIDFFDELRNLPNQLRDAVSIHGFMQWADEDPNILVCFSYGQGSPLAIATSADDPRVSPHWIKGENDSIDLVAEFLGITVETRSASTWGQILPHAMQIASLNSDKSNEKGSIYCALTNERDIQKAVEQLKDMYFEPFIYYQLQAKDRQLFKTALLYLISELKSAESNDTDTDLYDIIFHNESLHYLEIWCYDDDNHDFIIYHSKPGLLDGI